MDKFGLLWFTLASLLVTWDSVFILLRPRTMPGGDLHAFFKPYALYVWVDKRYGDMSDTFGIAQTWLEYQPIYPQMYCKFFPCRGNMVEIVLNLATVTLLMRRNRGAWLCGFLVSTMTFWKTVLYLIQYFDICNGGYMVAHLTWAQFLGLLLLPSSFWVVVPFYFMFAYGKILRAGLERLGTEKRKTQ